MDCLILAGNKDSYRAVTDKPNKAFLEIDGKSILQYLLSQVDQVKEIDRLLLVGPKAKLEAHLGAADAVKISKPVLIFEQSGDLVSNVENVVADTNLDDETGRYLLILPSDVPLMTCEELRSFISQCDMNAYDMVSGVTTEKALSRFYPTQTKPGVRMVYFYFQEGCFRINNMHMIRPDAVGGAAYIRKTYAMRYQKEWFNILKMMWNLFKVLWRNPDGLFIYITMSIAHFFGERGYKRLSRLFSRTFTIERAARSISRVLDTRFKIAVTHLGGAAIDVDNASDYEAIVERFQEWMSEQKELAKTLPSSNA